MKYATRLAAAALLAFFLSLAAGCLLLPAPPLHGAGRPVLSWLAAVAKIGGVFIAGKILWRLSPSHWRDRMLRRLGF